MITNRENKLLKEVGHTDICDALMHMRRMQTALKVIHTWASVDGCLDYRKVRDLCRRELQS